MSEVNEVNEVNDSNEVVNAVPNFLGYTFSEPKKREPSYAKNEVDNLLKEVQDYVDSVGNVSNQYNALVADYNTMIEEFGKTEAKMYSLESDAANASQFKEQLEVALEREGQLKSANKALRESVTELNNRITELESKPNDEAAQSTALLQRAAQIADSYTNEAKQNADKVLEEVRAEAERIVAEAHVTAQNVVSQSEAQVVELRTEVEELTNQKGELVAEFNVLLQKGFDIFNN